MRPPTFACITASFALWGFHVAAYIPALAVNDTSGMNFSDYSTLELKWYPRYLYRAPM